jgi:hypothetical protein
LVLLLLELLLLLALQLLLALRLLLELLLRGSAAAIRSASAAV